MATNVNFFASSLPKAETETNEATKQQPRELGDLLYFGTDALEKLGNTAAEAIRLNETKAKSDMVGIYTKYHVALNKSVEAAQKNVDEFRFGSDESHAPKV